ncbi:glycosyltransferase involved in cell wall biosynthesis [Caulobacter ginsengisoli]|uniref:Glycosyltransferase involved in cell wall biosynthesis n=1 Tax=Caulobacter ginsengisoli TaxID=400775 RepID=A0ABU0IX94_9CAUL|nr:glycosyltransferase family 2 protein [Caulobacter ginsengisoli]MDQ0466641.1 glycosyltransferase involved in cell wall biosynthesis [Caulobacter ginsengisoli]
MASAPKKTPAAASRKPASDKPDYSVVVPVFDEGEAAPVLAREIAAAFKGQSYEMVFVDDASRDDTRARLVALKAEIPQLRVLAHRKNSGQSRAVRTGVMGARGDIIVTLDGDGQNDPADAPRLAERLKASPPEMALIGGERVKRQDSAAKRLGSRFGNGVRKRLLKDECNDTGCGLKAFRREVFLRLPYFDHIHRYLPALVVREGFKTAFEPVNHRHRETGVSKYTNWGRLKASVSDLLGVMWLQSRARNPEGVDEV